jgi:hypothetical protein
MNHPLFAHWSNSCNNINFETSTSRTLDLERIFLKKHFAPLRYAHQISNSSHIIHTTIKISHLETTPCLQEAKTKIENNTLEIITHGWLSVINLKTPSPKLWTTMWVKRKLTTHYNQRHRNWCIRKKEKSGVPLPNFSFMITRTPPKTLATFLENPNQSL